MPSFLSPTRGRYSLISDGFPPTRIDSRSCSRALLILLALLILTSTFYLGRISHDYTFYSSPEDGPKLTESPRLFEYQRLFGEQPSSESDRAWLHLFPEYGGFFRHPTLAPQQRSTFSVFHQMHCLNGLRTSLWTLYDAATSSSNEPFNASSLPMESSPAHMRHCIDLLRQSLMCRPDLTVEAKDDALGGVRGFGTEHQCVDWDGLVDWTRNWQTWRWQEGDGKGGGEHGHDHGGHGHGG